MPFVVNRHGAVHSVTPELAGTLPQSFRPAEADEIAAWYAMQGLNPKAECGVRSAESQTDSDSVTPPSAFSTPHLNNAENNDGGADCSPAPNDRRRRRK